MHSCQVLREHCTPPVGSLECPVRDRAVVMGLQEARPLVYLYRWRNRRIQSDTVQHSIHIRIPSLCWPLRLLIILIVEGCNFCILVVFIPVFPFTLPSSSFSSSPSSSSSPCPLPFLHQETTRRDETIDSDQILGSSQSLCASLLGCSVCPL